MRTAARAVLRTLHPVVVLRWIRVGMLAMVCAVAIVYILVATDGTQQITSARRVDAAVHDIRSARTAAQSADKALATAARTGQLQLIGTGSEFANATARINTLLTSAAEGNAAGTAGRSQFQFVQGQLTTCLKMAAAAVRDYPRSGEHAVDAAQGTLTASSMRDPDTGKPIPGTGGVLASLDDLEQLQTSGLDRQRGEGWLDPVQLWMLACAPLLVMLALTLITTVILFRHFHRHIGPLLPASLAVTAAVTLFAALLTGWDEQRLAARPTAGAPLVMALALLALTGAGVLIYFAYRPRLAEYRFPHS
ncbi:hypothetical protein [Streptomyces sp. NBC_00483]|uniref:hypothetical protein n=1 Tax=Streptomyces sp. NBC_00483 TaxID=2975756 RepID=UPI002E1969BA